MKLTLEIRLIGVRVLVSASVVREMTLEFCIIHFIDQKYWKKLHNLIIHHLPLPNYRRKLFFLIKALTFCNLFHVEQIVRKLKVDTPINLDSEFRNIDACIGRKKHVLHHKNRIFNSLNFIENQVIANLFLPHKGQSSAT